MTPDVFAIAARLRGEGTPFVLATVVASYPPQSARPGAKAIVREDGTMEGWVGGGCVRPVVLQEAAEALADGRPRLVRMNVGAAAPQAHGDVREYPMTCQGEGGIEIYLEPVLAAPRLVILGHTPVAQSLARLGAALGFEIVVASGGAVAELFPSYARIAMNALDAIRGAGSRTFVVVATMGAGDEEALAAAAGSDAVYVGLVASRKKGRFVMDYVRSEGMEPARLERVKCPAGLNLGGMSASEIALSILAEIVQTRYATSSEVVARATPGKRRSLGLAPLPVDPICGMTVNPAEARHTLTVGEQTYYFCCPHCKSEFVRRQSVTTATT